MGVMDHHDSPVYVFIQEMKNLVNFFREYKGNFEGFYCHCSRGGGWIVYLGKDLGINQRLATKFFPHKNKFFT